MPSPSHAEPLILPQFPNLANKDKVSPAENERKGAVSFHEKSAMPNRQSLPIWIQLTPFFNCKKSNKCDCPQYANNNAVN